MLAFTGSEMSLAPGWPSTVAIHRVAAVVTALPIVVLEVIAASTPVAATTSGATPAAPTAMAATPTAATATGLHGKGGRRTAQQQTHQRSG